MSSVELSIREYDQLIKSLAGLSEKMDEVMKRVTAIDKETVALKEWRGFHETNIGASAKEIDGLKLKVRSLENYRWFLIGVSTTISSLVAVLFQLLIK
tara:strand:- start:15456 stop:15749 length:294 start_codon:yes stop_codon:yes gene_type:complete